MTSSPARFVFVLGTGRCGSTMVHELLALHDDVGFVSNLDDRLWPLGLRGRENGLMYRSLQPVTQRMKRRVGSHTIRFGPSEGYRLLEHHVSPMLAQSNRDLTAADAMPWLRCRLEQFMVERADAQAAPVFVHKFTGWPRAGLLDVVFPDAKFVHIIRDGRAVVSSWLQTRWWEGYRSPTNWQYPALLAQREAWVQGGRSFVDLAGQVWCTLIDAFDEAQSKIPADRWLTLKYEDITTDPRAATESILEFIGLSWTDAFGTRFSRRTFNRDRLEVFSSDLGPESVTALNAVLMERLLSHGYSAKWG